jgi:hypothetical protein
LFICFKLASLDFVRSESARHGCSIWWTEDRLCRVVFLVPARCRGGCGRRSRRHPLLYALSPAFFRHGRSCCGPDLVDHFADDEQNQVVYAVQKDGTVKRYFLGVDGGGSKTNVRL